MVQLSGLLLEGLGDLVVIIIYRHWELIIAQQLGHVSSSAINLHCLTIYEPEHGDVVQPAPAFDDVLRVDPHVNVAA